MDGNLRHSIGLKGQFAIPVHLQQAAIRAGIMLNRQGALYHARVPDAENTKEFLKNLSPDFVKWGNDDSLKKESMIDFLKFLHQPLRIIAHSNDKKVAQQNRELLHGMLRFFTTGSPDLNQAERITTPAYLEGDEHVEIENEMKRGDSWDHDPEFAQDPLGIGTVPGSAIGRRTGRFIFKRHDPDFADDPAVRELEALFWRILNDVTDNRFKDHKLEFITLSAQELQKFSKSIISAKPDKLMADASFAQKTERTAKKILAEQNDAPFEKTIGTDDMDKILMYLERAAQSGALDRAHARYNFSSRKNSAVPDILADIKTFRAVRGLLDARCTPNDVAKALSRGFAPLLALATDIMNSTIDAAARSKIPIASDFIRTAELARECARDIGNEKYKSIADGYKKTLGLVSGLSQTWNAASGATKGFALDIYNFMRESPASMAAALALSAYLYSTMPNNALSPEIMEEIRKIPENSVLVFTEKGLVPMPVNPADLPPEALAKRTWHHDPNSVRWVMDIMRGDFTNPIGFYKHVMFDKYVIDPANFVIGNIQAGAHHAIDFCNGAFNKENALQQIAKKNIGPMTDALFKVNLVQNFTHAGFWIYMFGKGWNHGLKGGSMLFKLAAPLMDLGAASMGKLRHMATGGNKDRVNDLVDFARAQNIDAAQAMDINKNIIPESKKSISPLWAKIAKGTAAGGALTMATAAFADMAGHSNGAAEPSAYAITAGTTGLFFLVYNFWDDICLNHLIGGGVTLAQGATLSAAYQKTAAPVFRAAQETKLYNAVANPVHEWLENRNNPQKINMMPIYRPTPLCDLA
jgi:hypothetical protein